MKDPYRNFKYEVEILGFIRAGFSKVSGLKETTEDIEYREGGDNESPRHVPGQTSYDDVTFEQGMSTDNHMVDWREEIYDSDNSDGAQGGEDFRRRVTVYLKNKAGVRVKRWIIKRAWPKELSEGDLDALGNEILIQSMVLANEGQKRETL